MSTLQVVELILLLLGFVCFLLAALQLPVKLNLIAAGLAFWIVVPIIDLVKK